MLCRMILVPTEATPLLASNGSPLNASRTKGLALGFSLGVSFSSLLVGAFYLGTLLSLSKNHGYISGEDQYQRSGILHADKTRSEESNSLASKYIATQFISFTINTLGGLAAHGECEGRNVDPNGVCYLGDAQNITNDVQHRLQIVEKVLKLIKNDSFKESPDVDHLDNVLKVVALPEFFWRGPNGAYATMELNSLFEHFADELKEMIIDDFFNDFLFCFGTIIAARSADDPREPWQEKLHATEVEYFNFSPVIKGGPDYHSYVVTKKYISGADFLSRTVLPNPTEEDLRDYADFDKDLETLFQGRNISIVQDNVIKLDGLRIGLEICLDHRLGVLWNDLLTRHHAELVDVLLITSAGMAIERGPNPVVPGGVVYLSDGGASSAACLRPREQGVPFHPNQVCRGEMTVEGLKHAPIGDPG
jgi:hypothetical protein